MPRYKKAEGRRCRRCSTALLVSNRETFRALEEVLEHHVKMHRRFPGEGSLHGRFR